MTYSKQSFLALLAFSLFHVSQAQISTNEVTIENTTKTEITGDLEVTTSSGKLTTGGGFLSINRNSTSCGATLSIGSNDVAEWRLKTSLQECGNLGDLNFINEDNYHALTIKNDGKVGIGISNPSAKLSVSGDISFTSKIAYIPHDDFDVSGNSVAHYGLSRIVLPGASIMGLSGFYGLKFFTEGKERISVLRDGKVGIGTTSPEYQMEVAGDLTIGKEGDSGELRFRRSSNGNPVGYLGVANTSNEFRLRMSSGSSYFTFWTNGPTSGSNEKMRLDPEGQLGIGTSTPENKLHVHGKLRVSTPSNSRELLLNAQAGSIDFYNTDFNINRYGTGNILLARGGGSVGIGTTTPTSTLEVAGDLTIGKQGNSGHINLRRSSDGNPSGYIGIANSSNELRFNITSGNSYMTFFTNGSGTSEKMRLNPNGYLGIGTTNPTEKLHVAGRIRATGQTGWSDFVFYEDYELPSLEEVEQHIEENGHLKDIPSEAEVLEEGIDLTEMDSKLLQKIEELTLYVIDLNKRVDELEKENKELKADLKE